MCRRDVKGNLRLVEALVLSKFVENCVTCSLTRSKFSINVPNSCRTFASSPPAAKVGVLISFVNLQQVRFIVQGT